MKYKIGDEVYWTDPDEEKCSTFGRVTSIPFWSYKTMTRKGTGDDIYIIQTERKGEVEVFEHELR